MARITTPLTAKVITHLKPLSDKEFKESKVPMHTSLKVLLVTATSCSKR